MPLEASEGEQQSTFSLFASRQTKIPLPPIAILPLGTGNDTARVLGWGGGYEGENLSELLDRVEQAEEVLMDRWTITFDPPFVNDRGDTCSEVGMLNYFSVGVDARIALQFHTTRNSNPQLFSHRIINKGWYGLFGAQNMVFSPEPLTSQGVSMSLDGIPFDISSSLESIIVSNIPSYAGGCDLWGSFKEEDGFGPVSFEDGKLEVMGLRSIAHMSAIQTGIDKAKRLGQPQRLSVRITQPIPVQVDGEPFVYESGDITITYKNRARMLQRTK
eukprot:TRINITY_DN16498_c0_g1_i1.p1 TRINITY_DN16498_c0_g1~~TRINITY_DN16498_c0_g1_i1.p1  ORF type:complete len:298 (-),score=92.98 TRINITY_DN16498_c0_g1_i1:71-889(-)